MALALALTVALLFAQGLGLLHRVAHGAADRTASATPQPLAQAPVFAQALTQAQAQVDPHAHGLFDGHRPGSDECRLLDQLAHADALLSVAVAAQMAPVAEAPLGAAPATLEWRHSAPYQARAPPRG